MTARRVGWMLGALASLGYLASGLAVIQQDEVGVVRRFGAVLPDPWPPGLHWGLPWGFGRVDRVARDRARAVTVGARGRRPPRSASRPTPPSTTSSPAT